MADIDALLAHQGVKGMKWGVRKDRASAVTVIERSGKKTVKTEGGYDRRATGDAKTAASLKQVAKKNSTDALTNKQLETAIKRMRLEQQYLELSGPKAGAGKKYVQEQLKKYGNVAIALGVSKYVPVLSPGKKG